MEKYNYVMKYVPARSELTDLVSADSVKISSEQGGNVSAEILMNTAVSAIESMLSMCSLVYMKCMEKLSDEI